MVHLIICCVFGRCGVDKKAIFISVALSAVFIVCGQEWISLFYLSPLRAAS